MERITSRQNPLITRLRRLGAEKKARRAEGVFLCEGVKLVGEALRWGPPPELLVVAEGTAPPAELPAGVRVVEVPEALLRAVSTVETPQGMLAVCRTPDTAPPETLPEGRLLVLDGVQDPGNVGTVWRTADAFGAAGLFLLPGCAEPFAPKTVRATMGACFRLPVWEGTLEDLTGGNPDTVITRAHFARVLVDKGYAPNMGKAFDKYLQYGGKYCMRKEVVTPEQAMKLLTSSGAWPCLAHPMQYHLGYDQM